MEYSEAPRISIASADSAAARTVFMFRANEIEEAHIDEAIHGYLHSSSRVVAFERLCEFDYEVDMIFREEAAKVQLMVRRMYDEEQGEDSDDMGIAILVDAFDARQDKHSVKIIGDEMILSLHAELRNSDLIWDNELSDVLATLKGSHPFRSMAFAYLGTAACYALRNAKADTPYLRNIYAKAVCMLRNGYTSPKHMAYAVMALHAMRPFIRALVGDMALFADTVERALTTEGLTAFNDPKEARGLNVYEQAYELLILAHSRSIDM